MSCHRNVPATFFLDCLVLGVVLFAMSSLLLLPVFFFDAML